MNKPQDRDRSCRPSWTATHFKTGASNSMTFHWAMQLDLGHLTAIIQLVWALDTRTAAPQCYPGSLEATGYT